MTQATWALKQTGHSLSATLVSQDGEMGYPGKLQLHCMIRLDGPNIHYELEATSSESTYFNPTWHHYFCLGNPAAFQDQVLKINATHAYANDADGIAIDERFMPAPLSHKAATIADWMAAPILKSVNLPVSTIILSGAKRPHLPCSRHFRLRALQVARPILMKQRVAATLTTARAHGGFDNAEQGPNVTAAEDDQASTHTGIRMMLKSSAPGLQVYTGQKLGPMGPGLAIEPMVVPNALAFGEWRSSVLLNAGRLFSRSMTLAFSTFN